MPPFRASAAWSGVVLALSALVCAGQSPEASPAALTNAAQIRKLTAAEAAKSIPVHLKGVVITEAGPQRRAAVIWDQTAGIYLLSPTNQLLEVKRGDLLEVAGVTDPGEFAPIVRVTNVQKTGSGALPDPKAVTFEELLSGGLDAQWVEVSGVVRNLDITAPGGFGEWHMDVAVGSGKVSVISNGPRPPEVGVDAQVRLQAACFYQFTQRRQVLRPVLMVPAGVSVEVVRPAAGEEEAPQVRSAASLLAFSPESAPGHRVHVQGIVTHQEPGTTVWIRDESGALRILTRQPEILRPGDQIDVFGFPKYGTYTPTLEDAVFQKLSSENPPSAVPVGTAAMAFDHPGDLISLQATLTEIERIPEGWALGFQKQGTSFKAIFKSTANRPFEIPSQIRSIVRVTGICSVIGDDSEPVVSGVWHPQTFQLWLRSSSDVVTIKEPPWWTPRRIILVLVMVTVGSVVITGFVMWLAQQRLREQARHRAMAEAEFTAILSERNRLAREIHDTLAQGLAATSVQLRLAKRQVSGAPEQLEHHLDAAQNLVRGSLEEARNSIWNMRSHVLETGDLAAALGGILEQMADGTEVKTSFETTGRTRRLAPVIENNLLRIGQEAITNATKHAGARHIRVGLDFEEKRLCLRVNDDGCGFDTSHPPPSQGGFGLLGMRERAADLNGELNVRSARGEGTTVNLMVPLSGE
jgi:signal transduction histidine kinase